MASAALASMNEPSWAHMGKLSSYPNSNPNPNDNPKKKQKRSHHVAAANGRHANANGGSPVVARAASDDAYSFNQTSTSQNTGNYGGYMSFNVASYTGSELNELRKRLYSELEQIRELRGRIESDQRSIVDSSRSKSKPSANKRPVSGVVGSYVDSLQSNGFDAACVDPTDFEGLLKECGKIVGKLIKHKHGYVFKTPVDAVSLGLHDYHLIVKKPMDLGTVKLNLTRRLYPTPVEFADDVRLTFNNALLYNPEQDAVNVMAKQMLSKFEDLFKPVQEQMDSIINQRRMEKLLTERELRATSEYNEFQGNSWNNNGVSNNHRKPKQKAKSSPVRTPQVMKMPERVQETTVLAHSSASTPSNPPQTMMNYQQSIPEELPPNLPFKEQKVGRTGTMKLPKPRAKDPNKRDMSMEEKQKLGLGLQSLPQEKMPQLIQIIRKRNGHLAQDGDEIELEIESLDTETLWELDRFVTNWKKMVSKTKRQALIMNNNVGASGVAGQVDPTAADDYMGVSSDKNDDDLGKKLKDNDDEDVDIDDDMPMTSFPPVEIVKDEAIGGVIGGDQEHDHDSARNNDHNSDHDNEDHNSDCNNGHHGGGYEDRGIESSSSSSSGSSSSGSSSSSDSDSGSSSGSDSDADDAHS